MAKDKKPRTRKGPLSMTAWRSRKQGWKKMSGKERAHNATLIASLGTGTLAGMANLRRKGEGKEQSSRLGKTNVALSAAGLASGGYTMYAGHKVRKGAKTLGDLSELGDAGDAFKKSLNKIGGKALRRGALLALFGAVGVREGLKRLKARDKKK